METILTTLWNWIYDASMLIVPQRCAICGRRLRKGENQVCLSCYTSLPFTQIKGKLGNKIERLFWGQIPIVKVNSFLKYLPNSESSRLFIALKYGNRPQIGYIFGRMMAKDLIETDFFDGIDYIVPIPLAKDRLRKRGYNQSEEIAKGISKVTSIPVDTHSVIRSISNVSQTKVMRTERKDNVKNIFQLSPSHNLKNAHVLLIDDILTTGATLISCAKEIEKAGNVRISILTLGLAGSHFSIERTPEQKENPLK